MLTYVLRHVCGTDALPTWWTANHISFPYQFRVTQSSCSPSFLSWSFFSSGISKYSYHQRSLAQYCPAVATAVAFNSKSHRHSLNTSQLAADLVLQRSTLHLQTAFVLYKPGQIRQMFLSAAQLSSPGPKPEPQSSMLCSNRRTDVFPSSFHFCWNDGREKKRGDQIASLPLIVRE